MTDEKPAHKIDAVAYARGAGAAARGAGCFLWGHVCVRRVRDMAHGGFAPTACASNGPDNAICLVPRPGHSGKISRPFTRAYERAKSKSFLRANAEGYCHDHEQTCFLETVASIIGKG